LIDSNHVLTAAHCILNDEIGVSRALSGNFRLAIGGLSQKQTMEDAGDFSYRMVNAVFCHPEFSVCRIPLRKARSCFTRARLARSLRTISENISGILSFHRRSSRPMTFAFSDLPSLPPSNR
jgi:hypothetical protein